MGLRPTKGDEDASPARQGGVPLKGRGQPRPYGQGLQDSEASSTVPHGPAAHQR